MGSVQKVAYYIQDFALFFYLTIYPRSYFTSAGPNMPPKGRVNIKIGFVTEKKQEP